MRIKRCSMAPWISSPCAIDLCWQRDTACGYGVLWTPFKSLLDGRCLVVETVLEHHRVSVCRPAASVVLLPYCVASQPDKPARTAVQLFQTAPRPLQPDRFLRPSPGAPAAVNVKHKEIATGKLSRSRQWVGIEGSASPTTTTTAAAAAIEQQEDQQLPVANEIRSFKNSQKFALGSKDVDHSLCDLSKPIVVLVSAR